MKFIKKIKETYKVVGVTPKKFQTGSYGQTLYFEKRGDKLFIVLQKNSYDVTKWQDKLVPKDVEWEKHGTSEYFEEDYKFEWEMDDGRVQIYEVDKNFPEEILDLKPTGKTFPLLRDLLEDDFTASWQSDMHDYMEGLREMEADRKFEEHRYKSHSAAADSWLDRLANYDWKVTSVPEFYNEKDQKEWLNAVVSLEYTKDKRMNVSKKRGRYTTTQPFGVIDPSKLTFANGILTVPTEYQGIKSTMSFKML